QHGAHRAAGDHTGTGAGRLEQHHAARVLTLNRVRDRGGDPGHLEEVLLGLLDTLGDGGRHLLGLAVPDADGTVAVAHHDQRGEAEPAAALDDLGDAVDRDDPFEMRRLLRRRVAPAALATTLAAVAAAFAAGSGPAAPTLLSWHEVRSLLELESGFAGGIGQGCDPPGVPVATTVEDHLADSGGLGPLRQQRAHLAGQLALGPFGTPDRAVQRGR